MTAKRKRTPELWERQDKEGSGAFEAFVLYRDMGTGRSIAAVSKKLDKNSKTVGDWCAKWRWVDRVAAWEAEYDRRRLEATTGERLKMERRQIQQAEAFQSIASAELSALGKRIMLAEKQAAAAGWEARAPILSPYQIARLAETGVKIERLNRGVATENVGLVSPEARQRGLQEVAKSPEARAALKAVIQKAREGR